MGCHWVAIAQIQLCVYACVFHAGARAGFNGSGSRGTSPARSSHSSFSSAAPMLAGGGTPRGAAPAIPQQQGSPAHAAQLDI